MLQNENLLAVGHEQDRVEIRVPVEVPVDLRHGAQLRQARDALAVTLEVDVRVRGSARPAFPALLDDDLVVAADGEHVRGGRSKEDVLGVRLGGVEVAATTVLAARQYDNQTPKASQLLW